MVESSCYCRPCNRNTHIGSEDSITLWIGHLSIHAGWCYLRSMEKFSIPLKIIAFSFLRALSHTFCLNCRAWTENLCMKMGPSADRKIQIQRFVWRTDHDDGSGISQSICSCFWSEHISWHWCLDTNILKIENCLQLRRLQALTVNFSHWDLPPWQGQGTIRVLSGQHWLWSGWWCHQVFGLQLGLTLGRVLGFQAVLWLLPETGLCELEPFL